MNVFGLTILRRRDVVEQTKASGLDLVTHIPQPYTTVSDGGWWPVVKEAFTGAWQRNIEMPVETVMAHCTAWSGITLIASDIAKMRLKLITDVGGNIWEETTNSAYSPVLRKPNHYQNRIQFLTAWVISKLTRGNTYVLKERDDANVVRALYILDPTRVQVLVAASGDVYYSLNADNLSGIQPATVVVPASEIIHDIMVPLFHPLVGVSPFYAMGSIIAQSAKIISNTSKLFQHGSQPGGVLTAPGSISNAVAERIADHWEKNFAGEKNIGKVAVLGDGLKYEPMKGLTAVDSQLIDQQKWGDEKICGCLHLPPYMVGVGPAPTYNNIEALNQQYYSQCLQNLIESIELCIDEGLGLDNQTGIEFDLDGLLRMDTSTRIKAASDAMAAGMAPNEVRRQFHGLGPVQGGEMPYLQEQNWPLRLLAARELPAREPTPPAPAELPPAETEKSFDYSALRLELMDRVKGLHAAA